MTYEVVQSESFEAEADQAYLQLNRFSPDFAARWYDGLLNAIDSLSMFPARCPRVDVKGRIAGLEVRQLLYRQGRVVYRIIYTILDDQKVRILALRHGAARWPDDPPVNDDVS
jgi:plasmid stabilization system protein ParE